jgi:hypothetical protein
MAKTAILLLLAVLTGCSGMTPYQRPASPCDAGESTYECQIERYYNVNVP